MTRHRVCESTQDAEMRLVPRCARQRPDTKCQELRSYRSLSHQESGVTTSRACQGAIEKRSDASSSKEKRDFETSLSNSGVFCAKVAACCARYLSRLFSGTVWYSVLASSLGCRMPASGCSCRSARLICKVRMEPRYSTQCSWYYVPYRPSAGPSDLTTSGPALPAWRAWRGSR